MLFNSWVFAAFFIAFFPIYYALRKHVWWRNAWILVASYFFYGWWNPRFVTLLAILASVDYLAALGVTGQRSTVTDRLKSAAFPMAVAIGCTAFMDSDRLWLVQVMGVAVAFMVAAILVIDRAPVQRQRKLWLYASVCANLGVLIYFKYCNFFIESAQQALASIGWQTSPFVLHVVLPIGLSFHVFQGLSRTIDCYRGVIKAEGSLTTVAAYLAFFPQLVAGPIERAKHLIPQFETVRPLNSYLFRSGAQLFLWGLFMKVVVADNVAPIANEAFGHAGTLDAGTALAGILAFTIQIYCDFCGYSNMARGLARCLGFDLMANFNQPYFSRTPSEFWRRWHISLSTWLRDYLYFALGGNRNGEGKTYRNLLLTMLLGGLWHGAAWTFVIWGAFHGLILIVYRALRVDAWLEKHPAGSAAGLPAHFVAWAVLMMLVMVGWVFFRAESVEDALRMFAALDNLQGFSTDGLLRIATLVSPLVIVECIQRWKGIAEPLSFGPFMWRFTAAIVVAMATFLISAPGGQDFIYFDF
jgi:alginate O-acetyltransferase complex protein AlgI